MSFELRCQAIPNDCELLERSKRNAAFGEFLTFRLRFERGENCLEPMWKDQDAEFCAQLQKLLQAHPELETRNCSFGSYFGRIEYLIFPARRDERAAGAGAKNFQKLRASS